MAKSRLSVLLSLMKGLLAAVALTLVCMVGVAALAVYLHASDGAIRVLNQLIKCLSILLGTATAVGRGGERGFVTGMALAMLYMVLGSAMVILLGGSAFGLPNVLGEILIGAALGGVAGAVLSNLPARRRRARTA